MTITEKEQAVLISILHNMFNETGLDPVWAECLNDSRRPSGIEGKTLSGVCASLAKKDLVICYGKGSDSCVTLTKQGLEAARGQG